MRMVGMHCSFDSLDHRPWPVPSKPWIMRQEWHDLLFVHWEIDPAELRPAIPANLELDLHDGKAWIGIVPFFMKNVAPRYCPAVPWLSHFPELNVRTYVRHQDKPGVWFFSLDVTNPIAVGIARRFFHLPYFRAAMTTHNDGENVCYRAERNGCAFDATYGPTGPVLTDLSTDCFERWATERYCLYAQSMTGSLFRGEIHHRRWPLQPAQWSATSNSMAAPFHLGPQHPAVLFSKRIDVVVWGLEKILG